MAWGMEKGHIHQSPGQNSLEPIKLGEEWAMTVSSKKLPRPSREALGGS
jgi:hypothetical protein